MVGEEPHGRRLGNCPLAVGRGGLAGDPPFADRASRSSASSAAQPRVQVRRDRYEALARTIYSRTALSCDLGAGGEPVGPTWQPVEKAILARFNLAKLGAKFLTARKKRAT